MTHHKGMTVDVPRGGTPHENHIVTGCEDHYGGYGEVVAPGDVPDKQKEIHYPQAGHGTGSGALGGKTVGKKLLYATGNPCGKRRLLQSELTVHRRYEPVAVGDHLARGDDVARLHNICREGCPVRKERNHAKDDQQKSFPWVQTLHLQF